MGRAHGRLRLGLEDVFMFDSKSENKDRTGEAVESVSVEVRVRAVDGPDWIQRWCAWGRSLAWSGKTSPAESAVQAGPCSQRRDISGRDREGGEDGGGIHPIGEEGCRAVGYGPLALALGLDPHNGRA